MPQTTLSSSRYFIGSLFGSIFTAASHVIFGVVFFELHNNTDTRGYVSACPTCERHYYQANIPLLLERIHDQFLYQMLWIAVYAFFTFLIFLIIGHPLFLLLRNNHWIKLWHVVVIGGIIGEFASLYFDVPIFLDSNFPNYYWLCSAYGALCAAIYWWHTHSSNK
jgi:hypothetical protein